jgi:hypothetical protein
MKKRLIFIIPTIAIILLLIVYFLLDYGYFNKYNEITACKDAKKGKIQIILWSDSDVTYQLERIYSKYGVRTNQIMTTNYNWRGVEKYNLRMIKELEKKMGPPIYYKFCQEIDSLANTWTITP